MQNNHKQTKKIQNYSRISWLSPFSFQITRAFEQLVHHNTAKDLYPAKKRDIHHCDGWCTSSFSRFLGAHLARFWSIDSTGHNEQTGNNNPEVSRTNEVENQVQRFSKRDTTSTTTALLTNNRYCVPLERTCGYLPIDKFFRSPKISALEIFAFGKRSLPAQVFSAIFASGLYIRWHRLLVRIDEHHFFDKIAGAAEEA